MELFKNPNIDKYPNSFLFKQLGNLVSAAFVLGSLIGILVGLISNREVPVLLVASTTIGMLLLWMLMEIILRKRILPELNRRFPDEATASNQEMKADEM